LVDFGKNSAVGLGFEADIEADNGS
jgi:hypothetical protein